MPKNHENHEALGRLYSRYCTDFGDASGRAIFKVLIEELGGMRVTVPSRQELDRMERDQRIKNMFNGYNQQELAILFGLSETHIRRILRGK